MNSKSLKISYHGFTIIELLVVIAIISTLAAILLPAFTTAKRSSQDRACQSNLKQLALATAIYVDTYNGNYPLQTQDGVDDWNASTAADNWAKALEKYVRNAHVPACGISRTKSACKTNCSMTIENASYPISYIGNGKIFGMRTNESVLTHASKTLLFQCGGRTWNRCWLAPALDEEYGTWGSYTSRSWCNHSGGTNIAYADSHIRWQKYETINANLTIFDL